MFADIVYGKCHCNACLASIAYIQFGWGIWRYGTVAVVECVNELIVGMVASSWRTIIPGFRHSAHITYAYEYMLGLCGIQEHELRDHTTCVPIIMAKCQPENKTCIFYEIPICVTFVHEMFRCVSQCVLINATADVPHFIHACLMRRRRASLADGSASVMCRINTFRCVRRKVSCATFRGQGIGSESFQ